MDLPTQQSTFTTSEPAMQPIESVQPPTSPATSTKMDVAEPKKSSPILAIVLSLLLVASLIAGTVLYLRTQSLQKQLAATPTPTTTPVASVDPTADWQTYINESLGVSFKYPIDYGVQKTGEGISLIKDPKRGILYISSVDNKQKLSPRDYLAAESKDPQTQQFTQAHTVTDITVSSLPAIRFNKKESLSGYDDFVVWISANNKIYMLNFGPKIEEKDLSDQILSTFRFTDSLSSDPTSSWNEYINDQFKFRIKVPKDIVVSAPTDEGNLGHINIGNKISLFFGDRRLRELEVNGNRASNEITNSPVELPKFSFLGNEYATKKTIFGDGGPSEFPNCNIGALASTYYFDDSAHKVLIYLYTKETQTCDKNGNPVITNNFEDNIQFAKNLLSTFRFTKE